MHIEKGDLADPRILALLTTHLARARAETEPGSSHALDPSGLSAPDVDFWALWEGETLVGFGALKRLDDANGEVKSMHVAEEERGRGAGRIILEHIIATACARGMRRLSLETGAWDYFKPAHALYRRHGFVECGPFGPYRLDRNSRFMTLELRVEGAPSRQAAAPSLQRA